MSEMAFCEDYNMVPCTYSHLLLHLAALLALLPIPLAHDGTIQEDSEGSILGDDGGVTSKRDHTDDTANTSADCREDGDDHTSSPLPSSRHISRRVVYLGY